MCNITYLFVDSYDNTAYIINLLFISCFVENYKINSLNMDPKILYIGQNRPITLKINFSKIMN